MPPKPKPPPPVDGMWIKLPVSPETAAAAAGHVERFGEVVRLALDLFQAAAEGVAALERDAKRAERALTRGRPKRRRARR